MTTLRLSPKNSASLVAVFHTRFRRSKSPPLALHIERIIDDELAVENFVVAEAQRTKAVGNPAQSFAGRMRIRWVRLCGAHKLAEQNERWIGKVVFLQNGIKKTSSPW